MLWFLRAMIGADRKSEGLVDIGLLRQPLLHFCSRGGRYILVGDSRDS